MWAGSADCLAEVLFDLGIICKLFLNRESYDPIVPKGLL